jgi:hypothetical protein
LNRSWGCCEEKAGVEKRKAGKRESGNELHTAVCTAMEKQKVESRKQKWKGSVNLKFQISDNLKSQI